MSIGGTLEAAEAACPTAPSRLARLSAAKRLYDVVGVVAALGVLWPTLALVALAIFLAGGRPILFTQDRVGLNGRRFRFSKFRTMAAGADGHLHEVLHLNGIRGPAFQIENDPRVTRIGRFLRASSLDELPQLWNVLVGEMSLAGPRPARSRRSGPASRGICADSAQSQGSRASPRSGRGGTRSST